MSVNDDSLKQIFALGKAHSPILDLNGDIQGVVIPEGYGIETFRDTYKLPNHIEAKPTFLKLESFIHYVMEFSDESTQIFANSDKCAINAVMNYHRSDGPSHASHIAEFILPMSDEWVAWSSIDGREMPQVYFAEFVEENRLNVLDPDGAALLEMVSNLQSKTTVEFQSNIRLSNGTAKLSYSEDQDTKGNGSFEIPSKLKLGMQVFRWEDAYQFDAFLRTRIGNGKAFFTIKLDKPKKILLKSFEDVCQKVAEQTGRTVVHGSV